MSFSEQWEERYRENTHLSIWPWSDVVSFVMRHGIPHKDKFRVLELGCGAGANIPFFQSLKVDYFAIEGSPTVVEKLHTQFPLLASNIVVGDFTQKIPFAGQFDLILDRAALTHNATEDIARCLRLVYEKLLEDGSFIGIDWFSTLYSEFQKGQATEDPFTRTRYESGPFCDVGRVHFSDKTHLMSLFRDFKLITLEHKAIQRELPDEGWNFASWNLVARKLSMNFSQRAGKDDGHD